MEQKRKKELTAQYRERTVTGGIYLIKNTMTGTSIIEATADLTASRNRFDFAQKTGGAFHKSLQEDWKKFGGSSFIFEILEELVKKETQTFQEFQSEIQLLKELWRSKISQVSQ